MIDCQDPAVHAKSFPALLEYIILQTRRELSLKRIDTSLGTQADQVSERFRRIMDQTLNDAQSNILLIFDEIENISPKTAASPHWRTGSDALLLWQTLRSFFQSSRRFKLTFCFVGTNPDLFETPKLGDIDNPVYLFTPKTFIPMLDLADTREMVSKLGYFMGLDFDHTIIAHLHNRFGGHPFFIRQLCSQIHKNLPLLRPQRVSLAACKAAEQGATSDIKGYLNEILNSLRTFYPDEYTMLEYLASGERENFAGFVEDSPSFSKHLIGYGIIVRRGNEFEFTFDAIAESVKANILQSRPPVAGERRQEIGRRRNAVEEELRSYLFRSSISLTEDSWSKWFSGCVSVQRISQLGPLNRREVFSRTKSPLYFMELLKFVRTCPGIDTSVLPMHDIAAAIDTVNTFRIDAHAKDITDIDYDQVVQSLELLESIFVPP